MNKYRFIEVAKNKEIDSLIHKLKSYDYLNKRRFIQYQLNGTHKQEVKSYLQLEQLLKNDFVDYLQVKYLYQLVGYQDMTAENSYLLRYLMNFTELKTHSNYSYLD